MNGQRLRGLRAPAVAARASVFGSIRYKLLVTYLLLVLLATGSLAAYVLHTFRSFYLAQVREDLMGRAMAVIDEVGEGLAAGDRARLNGLAGRFVSQTHLNFRVFDARLQLVAWARVPQDYPPWIQLPGMPAAVRGHWNSGIAGDQQLGSEKLYVVGPVDRNGKRLGYLRMSLLLGDFRRVFAGVQAAVAVGLLVTLAGCAFISLLLARSLTDPIRHMVAFAESVGSGRFGDRLEALSPDEMGRLATALNRMGEQLAHQEQQRRTFLAAVSHELRTPAANVQVTLESLLAGADEEPALRGRFLQAALGESERLSQLVRDLLDLARLEADGVRMEAQPVALASLTARAVEAIEPRLRERSIMIDVEVPIEAWVTGDRDRLLQVLMNLLDNAGRFTQPETAIRVTATLTHQEVELVVTDAGPGIAPEDLPFVFDHFYTADKSRARPGTRAAGGGGTGLGLAIVHQIVEAHGGRVAASNAPEGGACFTLHLPRLAHPPCREML